ncbi:MAG: 3-oxoadipate enol-lactonase [Nitriliruptorales bacterium]|nr:3-oxoadipate enol-lactonase [Nitriliruptorales bacterium]
MPPSSSTCEPADVTAVEVHHVIDGPEEAPVVVLSNSLGSNLSMWQPQVGPLAEHFRVLRYDQRGHGASLTPPGPYGLADLGRDALALLDRLEVRRAHFCGLSLGGMTGMWLAANAPERIDRLVLLCTSARLGPPEGWTERARTVRAHGTQAVAAAVVQRWFTEALRRRDPGLVARMQAMVAATPAEGYAACCEAIAALDLEGALRTIGAPTLVIAGADDPATPPEHAHRIATAIPDAQVAVLEGAAHLANVERAQAVTDLMLSHLTSSEGNR